VYAKIVMGELVEVPAGVGLTQTQTMSPLKIVRYFVVKDEHKEQVVQTVEVVAQRSVR
jgi:hypothetical protein